ncbi:MAG: hypothetical protein J0647_00720 [Campylobacteraceae bacterium]|nr:hypothetical protein [Campylobacteraceae bacterium]
MSLKFPRVLWFVMALILGLSFSGCTTWFWNKSSNVQEIKLTLPEKVVISELDILDRPYTVLSDILVTVNQITPLNATPTKELVNAKLKDEAVKIGADAVIYVQYKKMDSTWTRWNGMEGKGQAVKFKYY